MHKRKKSSTSFGIKYLAWYFIIAFFFFWVQIQVHIYIYIYIRQHLTGHSHRWIYRRIYSVGIIHSLTTLPMELIRRYFTVPATTTDEFTDGYLRPTFQTFTDNCTDGFNPSVCHTITDGLKSVGIFQAGNFFFLARNFRL
jgi:hypothetical protein